MISVVVLVFWLVCCFLVLFFLTQAYNLVSLPGEHENVKKEQTCYWLSVFHFPSGENN